MLDSANPTSPWVARWAHLLRPGSRVLDVACGHGRHVRWLAGQGHQVTAIDRDAPAIVGLAPIAEVRVADIENGPWPWPGREFDAVIVTNYLWRPLWQTLRAALASDGVLIYETFAIGNERLGRPSRPDFLLRPGELLELCQGLQVVAYEHGQLDLPARVVQRIAALGSKADWPQRASLWGIEASAS